MSGTSSDRGYPESPFPIRVDPSAEQLPASIMEAYGRLNESIAQDRARFGSTLQADHLLSSQQDISETAQEALRRTNRGEERTAIILGAGGCGDIPLEALVTDFDRTTLVDVHTEQTEWALSDLPGRLLGKVSLVKAEISGAVQGLSDAFERASRVGSFDRFLRIATAIVRDLDVVGSQAEFGEDYAFVCSQLLLTQLASIPLTYLSRLVADKYGRPLSMALGHDDESLILAINDYNIKQQTGHVSYLNRLSRGNGAVHFADTLAEVEGGQTMPMVTGDVLEEIGRKFDELRGMNLWDYYASPSRHFYVGSFSLAPKPAT